MSKIALYRKYRPKNFDEIIGQSLVIQVLKNAIKNENLYHSYIFAGPRGSGKTSIARIFSKAINCKENENGNCCNKCTNCQFCESETNFDIIELDAASNNGVDEIRRIVDTIEYPPTTLTKKVYIIDEAHMLSNSAWNAFLKTLEEPPKHIVFIFATTEIHKIPLTIISRCQQFNFTKLPINELEQLIEKIAIQENILISNEAKTKIAMMADGSGRDCLSFFDQLQTYANKSITIESLNELFGIVSVENKIEFLNLFSENNFNKLIELTNGFTQNYLIFIHDLMDLIIDRIIFLKTNDKSLIKTLTINNIYDLKLNLDDSYSLLQLLASAYEKIKLYDNGSFYLENLILDWYKNKDLVEKEKLEPKLNLEIKNEIANKGKDSQSIEKLTTKLIDNNFTYDNIFQTIKFKEKQEQKVRSKKITNKDLVENKKDNDFWNHENCQKWFNEICGNPSPDNHKILNQKLEELKMINDMELIPFNSAEKILTASNNYGAIILFNFDHQVDEFKKWYYNEEGYKILFNKIGINCFFLPCTKLEIMNEYKKQFNKDIKYNDIDINWIFQIKSLTEEEKRIEILKIMEE